METKQKTVTVEIPEGKMAVTERIKTIYDAQCELEQRAERGDSEARQLIKEYNSVNTSETSDDIVAYMQLRIITAALNEGWKPQFVNGGKRWCPYFSLLSKNEIDNMSDEDKDNRKLLLCGGSAYGVLPCCCSESYILYADRTISNACVGSRLVLKTFALGMYALQQFANEYIRFFIGDKASDAMPWREFEQKRKSSDNK